MEHAHYVPSEDAKQEEWLKATAMLAKWESLQKLERRHGNENMYRLGGQQVASGCCTQVRMVGRTMRIDDEMISSWINPSRYDSCKIWENRNDDSG